MGRADVGGEQRRDSDHSPAAPRIAFVLRTTGFPDGMAATNRVRLLAAALVDAGASVDILCTQANEPAGSPRNLRASGQVGAVRFEYTTGRTTRSGSFLARRFVDIRGFVVLVRRLCALSRPSGTAVCYLWITTQWNPLYRVATLTVLRLLRIPCVMELNEPPWSFGGGSRRSRGALSSLRGMAGVVAISRGLEEWAVQETRRRGKATPVIRVPAVSSRDLAAGQEVERSIPPQILLACAPEYRSVILFLIGAMERVWEVRDCELVVTGFGEADPRAAWLLSEPAYMRNRDRIVLAGHLDTAALLQRYALASALVAPLDNDERSVMRFPTKVAEYLMTGRPVVTSDIGDVGQLLCDSGGAYLAPPGDVDSFADRLLEVLDDPQGAEEVGRRGRAIALQQLDAADYGGSLVEFMAKVARAASP